MPPRTPQCLPLLAFMCLSVPAIDATTSQPATRPTTQPAGWRNVSVDEFQKLAKDRQNVILDVRTPREFDIGHIRGAVNIDLKSADFEKKIAQLDRSKTYLIYCRTGLRGTAAAKKMHSAGFKHLFNLDGGIAAWWQAGRPIR